MVSIADRLKQHAESVTPGKPFHVTEAHAVGDEVWQGDLCIAVAVAKPPEGYVRVENPTEADRQLAVEAGAGSHHRIRSLDGVTLWRPKNWGKDDTDLRGPFVVFATPNAIVHEPGHDKPHGTVFIDAPMAVQCRQQRNLDAETRREIRARD